MTKKQRNTLEKHLVQFGNYLLSDKRDKSFTKVSKSMRTQVYDNDIQNYFEEMGLNQPKRSWFNLRWK